MKTATVSYTGINVQGREYSMRELYDRAVEKGHIKNGAVGSMINDLEIMLEHGVTHVIIEHTGAMITIKDFQDSVEIAKRELAEPSPDLEMN